MAAESSLLELIEAMLTLASQSHDIFAPKPSIKPGGYPEEIFTNLSEQEKEDYGCAICYQILKEPMQCSNQHKFCHSCIYIWSTTGVHLNRTRCPVCRVSSRYQRCLELDTLLGEKRVKCNKIACRWSGALKFFTAHKHTYTPKTEGIASGRDVLPSVHPTSRPTPNAAAAHTPPRPMPNAAAAHAVQRLTPGAASAHPLQEGQEPILGRVRSSVRVNPYLRLVAAQNRTAGGGARDVPTALSNEPSAPSGDSASNGENAEEVTVVALGFTPRPPSGPRPAGAALNHRRTPTLPSLMVPNSPRPRPSRSSPSLPQTSAAAANVGASVAASAGGATTAVSPPPAGPWRPRYSREQNQRDAASLGNIRQRLQENRHRLDSLMASFSGELERSRQEAVEFQQERERLRRQQLEEVREMGRRLGHVAAELRRLLNNRQRPTPAVVSDSDTDSDDPMS